MPIQPMRIAPPAGASRLRRMLKRLLHWIIAIAVVLQLFSCIFLGRDHMPGVPF